MDYNEVRTHTKSYLIQGRRSTILIGPVSLSQPGITYRTLGNPSRFSRYCTASAKIKSAKILYDPSCSALCTGVLAKNKEAGLSVECFVYYYDTVSIRFSSVVSIKSFFTPTRRSKSD